VIRLSGGRVLDPANDRDEVGDVLIEDGHVVDHPTTPEESVIDASGYIVAPGFVDHARR